MVAPRRIPREYAIVALLAAMVLAVYGRTVSFPFLALDDEALIRDNLPVRAGLSAEGLRFALTAGGDAGYIPLTWLSRLADVSLFGMDAGKHHAVNVLFHGLNALLLFLVLRAMTGRTGEGALAAALFAVHPLHVESVAWVIERKDVLAGFFFLLAVGAYTRYAARPGVVRYAAVILFFLLGLLSKPILVTLPFVLLLLDYWPLGRKGPGRLIMEKLPLLALSAAASAATLVGQKGAGALIPLEETPLWARAGNALVSCAAYLRKAVWPSDLAVFYPHSGTKLPLWGVAAAGLFLCAATALALRQAQRRPWLATGWFWYLGTLVPVIGLVQVGAPAMADRCAYLPLIGIYLVAARGLGELAARIRAPAAAAVVAAGWVAALGACAWVQVGYWRSSEALFLRAVAVTRDNWLANAVLGRLALEAGRNQEAAARYAEALRSRPASPQAHNDLGVALLKTGRREEGLGHIREALRIQPDHPEAHNNLGVYLAGAGASDEALGHFREALRLRPGYAEAHHNLGMELARAGRPDEGIAQLREAIRLRPGYAEAHNNLGVLLARKGAVEEAAQEFREALRLRPGYEGARGNLDRIGSGRASP